MIATISPVIRWPAAAKPPADIPALVKTLREGMGLTQEQLAREIGVAFATVNSWENGRRAPLPFLLKKLIEMKENLNKQSSKDR